MNIVNLKVIFLSILLFNVLIIGQVTKSKAQYVIYGNWEWKEMLIKDGCKLEDVIEIANNDTLFKLRGVSNEVELKKALNDIIDTVNVGILNEKLSQINNMEKYKTEKYKKQLSVINKIVHGQRTLNNNKRLMRYLLEIIFENKLVPLKINNKGTWRWQICQEGDLSKIKKVEYVLPKYFAEAIRNDKSKLISDDRSNGFPLTVHSEAAFVIETTTIPHLHSLT